ncbi:hypothetical protein D3C80_584080 [compost metagenome]
MLHRRCDRSQPGQVQPRRDQEDQEGQGQRRRPIGISPRHDGPDQGARVHGQQEAGHRDQEGDGRRQRIGALGRLAQAVGHDAAQPDAGHAPDHDDGRIIPGGLRKGQAEAAHEEAGQPGGDAVAAHRGRGGAKGQQPEGGLGRQGLDDLAEGRGLLHDRRGLGRFGDRRIQAAALGVLDRQTQDGRHQDAEDADHDEGRAPAVGRRQQAADQGARRHAQGNAEGIGRQGPRALRLGEVVGDQGIGRSHPARLADAHAHAAQEQLTEAARHAAQGGEARPDGQGGGHDPDPAEPVGQPGDGNGQGRIEKGEGQAAQQAELGVRQTELGLQRGRQDADDLPVQEVQHVDEDQDPQHIIAIAGRDGLLDGLLGRCGLGRGHGVPPSGVFCLVEATVAAPPGDAKRKRAAVRSEPPPAIR